MTETIGGFELVSPFTNAGGGQSRWTFARRGGTEYFIKEFLSPKYPIPGAPGGAATRWRMARRCAVFEKHHTELTNALKDAGGPGGNLVVTREFFRAGSKYYRVTDKVDVSSVSADGISALPRRQQIDIALAVTHSVQILHQQGIVHGDLKPPNVLINDTSSGSYSAKLIDFDNAFFAGRPPIVEDLVGDPAYLSPELLAYVTGAGDRTKVGMASDIFALGVLFLEYFGADVPHVEEGGRALYTAEMVTQGVSVTSGLAEVWPAGTRLVSAMLSQDPARRPSATGVHKVLKELRLHPDHVQVDWQAAQAGWPPEMAPALSAEPAGTGVSRVRTITPTPASEPPREPGSRSGPTDANSRNKVVRPALEPATADLVAALDACVAACALVVESTATSAAHLQAGPQAVEQMRAPIRASHQQDASDPVVPVEEDLRAAKEVALLRERFESEDARATRRVVAAVFSLVAISGFEFYSSIVAHGTDMIFGIDLSRVIIALPLAVAAAYLGREASSHRLAARQAHLLSVQLDKLDDLDALERSAFRVSLGRYLFSGPLETRIEQLNAPDVLRDVGKLAATVKRDKGKKDKKKVQSAAD